MFELFCEGDHLMLAWMNLVGKAVAVEGRRLQVSALALRVSLALEPHASSALRNIVPSFTQFFSVYTSFDLDLLLLL